MKKVFVLTVLLLTASVYSFDNTSNYQEKNNAKYMHIGTTASINLVTYKLVGYIHPELDWKDKLALSNFYTFSLCLSKEVFDNLNGGHFSREDMYYNASGLFISTGIMLILNHFKILK